MTAVVGALVGLATSHYYFRRGGAARSGLLITLEERTRIDPSTLGVKVDMRIGTIQVSNLVVLEIAVANRGHRDLVIDDAAEPAKHPLRPRVELPEGLRSLAAPWNPDGAAPGADVRIARQLSDNNRQVLFVHLHRLAKGATCRATVLCTYRAENPPPRLSSSQIRFFPGFLPDVDIRGAGLLKDSVRVPV